MENRNIWIGIVVLLVAVGIAVSNSVAITQFSISDSNPSTYIIVVMLMMFLFIVFSVKERLAVRYRPADIFYGFLILAAFFITTSLLRSGLSFLFATYRVDALMFPVILLSIITAMFGKEGIIRLKWLIVYSAFASPILAMPFIALNKIFVSMNASFVYGLLKMFGAGVSISGLVISAPSASTITIAATCADIGAFIGLVMFLLPISYMLDGRLKRKVMWIASGVALLLALNFIRMLVISLEWMYYGIGSAVSTFHIFAGQIMFDAVIIVMIVLFYKYGLRLPSGIGGKAKGGKRKATAKKTTAKDYYPIIAAIAIGIISFAITYPYHSMINVSNSNFYNTGINATNGTMSLVYLSSIRSRNSDIYSLGHVSNTIIGFSISNSISNYTEFVAMTASGYPDQPGMMINMSGVRGTGSYIFDSGVVLHTYTALSEGQEFYLNAFSFPAMVSSKYASIKYDMIFEPSSWLKACNVSSGYMNRVESGLVNLILLQGSRGTVSCDAYESAAAINGSVNG